MKYFFVNEELGLPIRREAIDIIDFLTINYLFNPNYIN